MESFGKFGLPILAGAITVLTLLVIFFEGNLLPTLAHEEAELRSVGGLLLKKFKDQHPGLKIPNPLRGKGGGSASLPGGPPYFHPPPEVRHPTCVARSWNYSELPRASLVIPYLNETWQQVRATVAALIEYSCMDNVDEILFIDDGNQAEFQFHKELQAMHPKVQVHRNPKRQGLIRSKIIGVTLVKSPVIVFMEPHCIVSRHWLEPLLEQLAAGGPEHSTVVMPTLDIIPEDDFTAYKTAHHHIGGFDWSLTFNWKEVAEKRNSSYVYPDPYPTPALSGGIFGIWRDFWDRSGGYDDKMGEWGGEHIEMSLRTWRCGGRIEVVPCSRIGHVFRQKNPYVVHTQTVIANTKRAALVWLDGDYLEKYYSQQPGARYIEAGDVSQRVALKKRLQCESMDWYIENVYPELKKEKVRGHR